ncbi:MAG: apolipoprotein N-acyltransferase [Planctomycetota bacterium]
MSPESTEAVERTPRIAFPALAVLLAVALPPSPVPGGGLLIVPACALWFAIATNGRRPCLQTYLCGVVAMSWMSWSLRHLTWPGYIAIGVLGGLYFALATAVCRFAAKRGLGALGFAIGVAGTQWLRAHLPEIWYPHGQTIHALYETPVLLGSLRYIGEAGGNFALALFAASLVVTWRSWRRAEPGRSRALALLGLATALFVLPGLLPSPIGRAATQPVDVAAIEPGLPAGFMASNAPTTQVLLDRLIPLSLEVAGRDVADPPDLLVWPESSFPRPIFSGTRNVFVDGGLVGPGQRPVQAFADSVRLLAGGELRTDEGRRRGVTVLVGPGGEYHGHQQKIHPVPGGERIPFVALLPEEWVDSIVRMFTGLVRTAPNLEAGEPREVLRTASGVPFSAFLCFDNAFDDVSRRAVRDGAAFCAVASNEAWYRQGGELQQMIAMTVCRAIETGLPWIRSTVDGLGVLVEPNGEIRAELGQRGAQDHDPRVLRATFDAGAVHHPTLSLQAFSGPLLAVVTVLVWLLGILARRKARS